MFRERDLSSIRNTPGSRHPFLVMFLSSLLVQTSRGFAVRRVARHAVAAGAPLTRLYSSKSEKGEDPVASFFDELARKEGFDSDSAMYAQFEEEEDATTTNAMDARISQARRDRDLGKVTVSSEMDDYFASLGYQHEEEPFGNDETPRNSKQQPLDRPPLPHAQLVTDPLSCSACGSRFQTNKEERPGYLPTEKYELQVQFHEWKQTYDLQQKAESREWSAEDEIDFLIEAAKENEPEIRTGQSVKETEEDATSEATMHAMLSSDKPVICKRCFRLQHHGQVEEALRPGWTDDPALQQENFRRLLAPISSKTAVIIALVDLFDFSGSVLPELDWIAGEENPVILAANKADLLPPRLGPNRAENWVRRELEYLGVKSIANVGGAVRLISCKTGAGVRSLLSKAEKLASERDCDIYVVGAANAGKSTFLNHILMQNKQDDGDDNKPVLKKRAGNMNKFKGAVTTSPLPGTTLQFLKVDLGNARSLYDTPGLLVPGTITQLLSTEELKVVVPKRYVSPLLLLDLYLNYGFLQPCRADHIPSGIWKGRSRRRSGQDRADRGLQALSVYFLCGECHQAPSHGFFQI